MGGKQATLIDSTSARQTQLDQESLAVVCSVELLLENCSPQPC